LDYSDSCDAIEFPVKDAIVNLYYPYNTSGVPDQTTMMDPFGDYEFDNVTPRTSIIEVIRNPELEEDPFFIDPENDQKKPVDFDGITPVTSDQGLVPTRDVVVTVCVDFDYDRVCDADKTKLSGVPVTATLVPSNPKASMIDPVTTGTYDTYTLTFENVPIGQ
jgi:hypothetical protein